MSKREKQGESRAQVDPELLRQVEAAESAEAAPADVQAVVFLAPMFAQPPSERPDIDELVSGLLARVEKTSGEHARDVHIFRNLGSLVIEAPPRFVRTLIEQPEVKSARANRPRPSG